MPQYSPLPNIELDPRNEAELVQAAARRVYEASNATLNDFSSGSPIVALLEGQAFAQAEFLQFANQFPESVLVEWIGPFLGAQRRTGAGARVQLTITIDPRDDQFDVFAGFQAGTDPNLTGGEQVVFVTTERLIIPPGQSEGTVNAISVFRSAEANVAPNTIISPITSLSGVRSITNKEAAGGGQDPELLSEVKERFFSLIRRRNPVSAEDWTDFFSDALGPGASCAVLPRRSERGAYSYQDNFVNAAPAVSFFVLNPDGSPITSTQQGALQNLIRWSLPVEFLGFVYPMEVNNVDFFIDIEYDATKPYSQNLTSFSEIVRNNLFGVMTPNAVFPIAYDQQVTDVESALTTTFPLTLGTTNQYLDPDVQHMRAYVPPKGISNAAFTLSTPVPLKTGSAIKAGDLAVEQGNTSTLYYEALQDFTPQVSDKSFYVNNNAISVEIIRELKEGEFKTGDVITENDGHLSVVLTAFTFKNTLTIQQLRERGFVSEAKEFTFWAVGREIASTTEDGTYDPMLIEYTQDDTNFNVFIPSKPTDIEAGRRVGAAVYVARENFTIVENTTTLGSAQDAGLISTSPTALSILEDGASFQPGDFVKTPDPTELRSGDINRENCYIDRVAGAVEVFAKVNAAFTFILTQDDYVATVDQLAAEGVLEIVQPVPFVDCKAESSFASKPFRYQARFSAGEYVRYRATGGFEAADRETCLDQVAASESISEDCNRTLVNGVEVPRYFFVLKDFTPDTTSLNEMVDDGLITEVSASVFDSTYLGYVPSTSQVYSTDITFSLEESGVITAVTDLKEGDTCLVVGDFKESRGLWVWTSSLWIYQSPGLPTFRDLFRFAPGDVVSFRSSSETRSYIATQHVTPVLSLEVYFDNGIFERSDATQTVAWSDPTYRMEDMIFTDHLGAYSFYRVVRSFTPPAQRTVWNDSVVDTSARTEEIFGNLLKFVNRVEASDAINSRLNGGSSTVKLGTCQLNLTSKSVGSVTSTFVFESTDYNTQSAKISSSPNSTFNYGPVDYGTGTLAL